MMNLIIQTANKNTNSFIEFYAKLNFVQEKVEDRLFFRSTSLDIEINSDKYARTSLDIYLADEKITELTSKLFYKETDDAFVLNSPSGLRVNLKKDNIHFKKGVAHNSTLGNYCGISIEAINMSASLDFWTTLGFEKFMGDPEQGWLSLKNQEGYVISIMGINICPHIFTNPSLTFFNGKNNPEIVQQIRELNIPIAEEITEFNKNGEVDNVVIRDPGGLGMFIFNDEV